MNEEKSISLFYYNNSIYIFFNRFLSINNI